MKLHIRLLLSLTVMALLRVALADPAPLLASGKDADGRPLPFGHRAHRAANAPLGTGPFRAIMSEDASLPDHTLYYPADLGAAGRLPVIVWGNGACLNAGNRFRDFLTEIASHGFMVIAGGPIDNVKYEVGPQENPPVRRSGAAPAPLPAAARGAPAPGDAVGRNTVQQLLAGLDWAEKAEENPASPFYHRLEVSEMGVAGQSCGGMLATAVSADPRIKATALFSGAPMARTGRVGGKAATPEDIQGELNAIHAPILLLAGDATHDVAHEATVADAGAIRNVPVFAAWQEKLTHIGTYGMPDGGELGRLAWQWFAWQLRGDTAAAGTFRGADCGLCRETPDGWHVIRHIPQ